MPARANLIQGDNACYQTARKASDGVEHGFMEASKVNRSALKVTESVFAYVRQALIYVVGEPVANNVRLGEREPLDVQSMRKMSRGYLSSDDGRDPSPPEFEYPTLEWTSKIGRIWHAGDGSLQVSFDESMRFRAADGVSFEGRGFEVVGRPNSDGSAPVELNATSVRAEPALSDSGVGNLVSLCNRARSFTSIAAGAIAVEVPAWLTLPFRLYGEQVAILESIELLAADGRGLEASGLIDKMLVGAAVLELVSEHQDGAIVGCMRWEWQELNRFPEDMQDEHLARRKQTLLPGRSGTRGRHHRWFSRIESESSITKRILSRSSS